jgi:hypothetical protein
MYPAETDFAACLSSVSALCDDAPSQSAWTVSANMFCQFALGHRRHVTRPRFGAVRVFDVLRSMRAHWFAIRAVLGSGVSSAPESVKMRSWRH